MSAYIDAFAVPVPSDRKADYIEAGKVFAAVFKDCGALSVVEYWGDDVPEGKLTSFPLAVKLEPGETVVLSWVSWPSKEARDVGNEKARTDPRMAMSPDMPLDFKRMIFGGFALLNEV